MRPRMDSGRLVRKLLKLLRGDLIEIKTIMIELAENHQIQKIF